MTAPYFTKPTITKIRVQTDLDGELAKAVKDLSDRAQIPLAAALRLIALRGLEVKP